MQNTDIGKIKLMGGIGIILSLLGSFIPTNLAYLFYFTGLILLALAMKQISDIDPRREIFKNFLIGIFVNFIGGFIFGASGFSLLMTLSNNGGAETGSVVFSILGLLFAWIVLVISALFLRKAFRETAEIFNEHLFNIGGNLLFWGAVATIIFIGGLVIFAAWVVLAVAFFSIKDMNLAKAS